MNLLQPDHEYALFTAATVAQLQQRLNELAEEYNVGADNQAFRILNHLKQLSELGKGLRLDTKYGIGSYWDHRSTGVMVKFDGDIGMTGLQWKSVNTFWFELD